MSSTLQWILYGVLIVILGVVGYYVGKNYASVGPGLGTGIGIVAGALISGVIYMATPAEEAQATY